MCHETKAMPLEAQSAHHTVIFMSCADEDKESLEKLYRAFSSLMREGHVECRHRYHFHPGSDWQEQTKKDLQASDIILLLVSPFFVASDYLYKEEAELAMAQYRKGKTHVIPIILQPIIGLEQLVFGSLKNLPEGKAVSMWSNKEEAFTNIVRGVKGVLDGLKSRVQDAGKPLLHWNVPYWRNPFFTGREKVLADLREAFTSPQRAWDVQALSGLAGVGKTQVAVEYAYRYTDSYQAVLWVHADSSEILLSSFVTLAETLGLPEKDQADQPLIIRSVKKWLQQHPRWLLIVDNLEDVDLLQDTVPSPHSGHILVTTRSHRTGHIAHRVDLLPLSTDDGALLLLRRAKLLSSSAGLSEVPEAEGLLAKEIVAATDGLPLALDQAGAYIEETGRGLPAYVALYQQYSSSLLKRRGTSGRDHPSSVTTTFALSFEKLETLNPAAIELLKFCAFLQPDAIPEEMIVGGAAMLPEVLRTAATDPLEFDRTIEDLLKFSLIKRESNQNDLSVHRLVQAVVKDTLSDEQQQVYGEHVVNVMDTLFPSPDFSNWATCQRYLPQAQACAKLIQQHKILLPRASQLLYRVGTYLTERGLYDEAEALLKQASVIEETLFGTDHPGILPLLNALANVYYQKGKYDLVEPTSLRVLTLSEKKLGADHPGIAESLNTLARAYHKQGRFRESEPLLQRALALRQQTLGPQHPDVAISLNSLANFYNGQGKYDQAGILYRQALTIQQQALGYQHPKVASCLNNIAVLYSRQGKHDQAEPLAEQALQIYEATLGLEHPDLTIVLDTLTVIYQEQGKYSEAEPLYTKMFAIYDKLRGSEHPQLVVCYNNLARLRFLQGRYSEAEATIQRALTLGEKVLGSNHHRIGTSLNTLADIYKAQNRYVEAKELYRRALDIREKALGPNDVNTAYTLQGYANLLQLMGQQEEAEILRKRADTILSQYFPS
jgi:tetratricopeptide (TPR) repeat protein